MEIHIIVLIVIFFNFLLLGFVFYTNRKTNTNYYNFGIEVGSNQTLAILQEQGKITESDINDLLPKILEIKAKMRR